MSISEVFGVVMSSRYVAPGTAKQPRDFVSFERRVQSVPVPVPTFPTHARSFPTGHIDRVRHGGPLLTLFFFVPSKYRSADGTLSLPAEQWPIVKRVVPGTPLFLYDEGERTICGVYEAVRSSEASFPLSISHRGPFSSGQQLSKWISSHFPTVRLVSELLVDKNTKRS